MSGFDYGNTRVRARHARRLTDADYSMLLTAGGLDPMLGRLADSVYADEIEAAVARYRGARRLDEAVRRHLVAEIKATLSFYEGPTRDVLRLVETRWDVRALTALLRGQASPQGATDLVGWLVPAGRIDEAAMIELAAQPGVRAMIDLVVAWKLPDRDTARELRRGMAGYQTSRDTAILEAGLYRAHAAEIESIARPADALLEVLRSELVAVALDIALRMRAARLEGETLGDVRSGVVSRVIPVQVLDAIVDATESGAVAEIVLGRPLPPGFDAAIERWAGHQDLSRLADDLVAAITRRAVSFLRREPLGLGVPVGYLWAKEQETRNLRLIGRAHIHGLDASEVEERLVVV